MRSAVPRFSFARPRDRALGRLRRRLVALIAVVAAGGCGEASRTVTGIPRGDLAARATALTDAVPGDISRDITLPPQSSWDGSGEVHLGTSAELLYRVTIDGRTAKYYEASDGTPGPIYYEVGICPGGLGIVSGGQSLGFTSTGQPCFGDPGPVTAYHVLRGETVAVRRSQSNGYTCGPFRNELCWSFQDAKPFRVTIVYVPVDVAAVPDRVNLPAPGGTVTVDLRYSASDPAAPLSAVPLRENGWTWTPDGGVPVVPPGQSLCFSSRDCLTFSAWESGWLHYRGLLNGVRRELAVRVEVRDELLLKCYAAGNESVTEVVRGAEVECRARMASGRAFTVRSARGMAGGYTLPIRGAMEAGGAAWSSRGPAALASTVSVSVSSGGRTYDQSAAFAVAPRNAFAAPQIGSVSDTTSTEWGEYSWGHRLTLGQLPPELVRFARATVRSAAIPVERGPNEGLVMLGSTPAVTAVARINAVLFSNRPTDPLNWKTDQNGTDGRTTHESTSGYRWCSASDIPTIINYTRTHEGVGLQPHSHAGIYNAEWTRRGSGARIEQIVARMDAALSDLWLRASAEMRAIVAEVQPEQDAFDKSTEEIIRRLTTYRCAPDMVPGDTP